MSSSELRNKLIQKTGWTKQALSARVVALRNRTPMATETAHGVLAQQYAIPIHKYLDDAKLRLVQEALAHLSKTNPAAPSQPPVPARKGRVEPKPRRIRSRDPLISPTKLREAEEMAAVYPLLYLLENSMRELIRRVMLNKYGTDWWDTALVGGKVKSMKESADSRRRKEDQNRWHQRRGAHPIDYIDLKDLGTILDAKQLDFFPKILGDKNWFDQFMRELEPSRNVVCHMNPLTRHNIADLKLKSQRWSQLMASHEGGIPG